MAKARGFTSLFSKEELACRGHQPYEAQRRSQFETEHQGQTVVIATENSAFEIAKDSLAATKQR